MRRVVSMVLCLCLFTGMFMGMEAYASLSSKTVTFSVTGLDGGELTTDKLQIWLKADYRNEFFINGAEFENYEDMFDSVYDRLSYGFTAKLSDNDIEVSIESSQSFSIICIYEDDRDIAIYSETFNYNDLDSGSSIAIVLSALNEVSMSTDISDMDDEQTTCSLKIPYGVTSTYESYYIKKVDNAENKRLYISSGTFNLNLCAIEGSKIYIASIEEQINANTDISINKSLDAFDEMNITSNHIYAQYNYLKIHNEKTSIDLWIENPGENFEIYYYSELGEIDTTKKDPHLDYNDCFELFFSNGFDLMHDEHVTVTVPFSNNIQLGESLFLARALVSQREVFMGQLEETAPRFFYIYVDAYGNRVQYQVQNEMEYVITEVSSGTTIHEGTSNQIYSYIEMDFQEGKQYILSLRPVENKVPVSNFDLLIEVASDTEISTISKLGLKTTNGLNENNIPYTLYSYVGESHDGYDWFLSQPSSFPISESTDDTSFDNGQTVSVVYDGDITLPTYQTPTTSCAFPDVSSSEWYYRDLNYLYFNGIINGNPDGTFGPTNSLNVDAYIKMVVSALGFNLENGPTYWASNYIDKGIELQLFQDGYFDDYVRPITRGEMALIAANAVGLIENITPYRQYQYHISDYSEIPEEQKHSVLINLSKGIITGFVDDTFRDAELATRSQAAAIITRLIEPTSRKSVDYFAKLDSSLRDEMNLLTTEESLAYSSIDEAFDYALGEDVLFDSFDDGDQLISNLESSISETIELIRSNPDIDLLERDTREYQSYIGDQPCTVYADATGVVVEIEYDSYIFSYFSTDSRYIISFEYPDISRLVAVHFDENIYIVRNVHNETFDGYGYQIALEGNDTEYLIYNVEDYVRGQFEGGTTPNSESYFANNDQRSVVYHYLDGFEYYTDVSGEGFLLTEKDDLYYVGESLEFNPDGVGKLVSESITTIGNYDDYMLYGEATMIFDDGLIYEDLAYDDFFMCQTGLYTASDNDVYAFYNQLERIVDEIIDDHMTTEEKVKSIHDYLVLNVTYSQAFADKNLTNLSINTAYSAINDNLSVCLGYAEAFNQMLTIAGIESYLVIGDADQDGNDDHAWNYVKFDEGFYHVDVTWDDPDSGTWIRYDYFKVSHSALIRERGISNIVGMDD